MTAQIAIPIKGMFFTHDSFQSGGVVAFATNFACEDSVGTLSSVDSGVMPAGQRIDQLTVFGGRDLRRLKLMACSVKTGRL